MFEVTVPADSRTSTITLTTFLAVSLASALLTHVAQNDPLRSRKAGLICIKMTQIADAVEFAGAIAISKIWYNGILEVQIVSAASPALYRA